jgi:hypothetical protein
LICFTKKNLATLEMVISPPCFDRKKIFI